MPNLCDLDDTLCRDNKGLSRDQMPQIESEKSCAALQKEGGPVAEAVEAAGGYMNSKKTVLAQVLDRFKRLGVEVHETTAPAGWLRATQGEINADKVEKMAESMTLKELTKGRILVSRDGFIVDGHHRWATLIQKGHWTELMDVYAVGMDIDDLLNELRASPGVYAAGMDGEPLPPDEQVMFKNSVSSKFVGGGEKTAGLRQASFNRGADARREFLERAVIRLASRREGLGGLLKFISDDRAVRGVLRGTM
jgi:hypothetical protein